MKIYRPVWMVDSVGRRGCRKGLMFARLATSTRPALVNGAVGAVSSQDGRLTAVLRFIVAHQRSPQSTFSPTRAAGPPRLTPRTARDRFRDGLPSTNAPAERGDPYCGDCLEFVGAAADRRRSHQADDGEDAACGSLSIEIARRLSGSKEPSTKPEAQDRPERQ